MKKLLLLLIPVLAIGLILIRPSEPAVNEEQTASSVTPAPDPDEILFIDSLKKRDYPASDINIEETLEPGINYRRYIASYQSDGLKIYGLFTVPVTAKPGKGFPSVVFLHGFLDPETYQTTGRYVAYQDGFARNGFITFKPDLRGHGRSEGTAVNSNFAQDYVVDALNLVSAIKKYPDADPELIGMWGHSNGGGITLRVLEVSSDVKAAVIWAGVVGSYEDLLERYRARIPWIRSRLQPSGTEEPATGSPLALVRKYGEPDPSSSFWSRIDPYSHIRDISAPVQLHHGTADDSVPVELSLHFRDVLIKEGKTVEYYEYPNGDHNLSGRDFSPAMERSISFFTKYLK